MKTRIFAAAAVLSLIFAMGTVSAAALTDNAADAVSSATEEASPGGKTTQKQKTFTAKELAAFDGKNGNKAYIAVNGTVYDVTALFSNGSHHGIQAGQDVTAAFKGQHNAATLKSIPVVGHMQGGASQTAGPLTQQEQKRLVELRQEEKALEQKEDALKRNYRSGTVTLQEYLNQKAALETQENTFEPELDALEDRLELDQNDGDDDDDDYDVDDYDDDHDDRDDDED